jgi:hypothetical protein
MKNQSPSLQEIITAVTAAYQSGSTVNTEAVSTAPFPLPKENELDEKIRAAMAARRKYWQTKTKQTQ